MADRSHYTDSGSVRNPEQHENNDPATLLRKCERAIDAGHFEAAETYHAQWVDLAAGEREGDQ